MTMRMITTTTMLTMKVVADDVKEGNDNKNSRKTVFVHFHSCNIALSPSSFSSLSSVYIALHCNLHQQVGWSCIKHISAATRLTLIAPALSCWLAESHTHFSSSHSHSCPWRSPSAIWRPISNDLSHI